MPAPSTPQTIPDVTEDIETGSGSGLGRSRDNGIFDQMRANDAVYFCFGSRTAIGQFKTFACPSNTFRKADRHALRSGVLAYSVPHP
jgi:hypothetical protein